jgi:hypothetical protein
MFQKVNVPVLGNVYVLSYGAGKTMNAGKVPGCVVTDELLEVLKKESQAPDKGKAARLEGFGFVGMEREAEYFEIAVKRIEAAQLQGRMNL